MRLKRPWPFIWLACILTLLAGCQKTRGPEAPQFPASIHALQYPLEITPLISAHRGGRYIDQFPENCLETFQLIASKYDFMIECDVAQSADGKLLLMHDDDIERTTDGKGKVDQKTWEELATYHLKDHNHRTTRYGIPLLEEVLKWAPGDVFLSLDIKSSVDRQSLIALLQQHDAHRFAEIITYSPHSAEYYSSNAPEYRLSVNVRSVAEYQRLLDARVNIDNVKPFVGTRQPSPELIRLLHEEGLIVTLGVLGNIDRQARARGFRVYDRLVNAGVDILATDYPLELASHIYD